MPQIHFAHRCASRFIIARYLCIGAILSCADVRCTAQSPGRHDLLPSGATTSVSMALPTIPDPKNPDSTKGDQIASTILAKSAGDQHASRSVSLFAGFAQTSPYEFKLVPSENDEWQVFLTSEGPKDILSATKLLQSPMATISYRSAELSFRWNSANVNRYSAQLANTLIEIKEGGITTTVALREPVRLQAIALDLNKASSRTALQLDASPDPETLAMRLNSIESPEPRLIAQTPIVALDEPLLVNRRDAISTQLELKLARLKDGAELRLAATYKDANDHRAPFIGKDVTTEIATKEKLLQTGSDALRTAQSAIPQIQSRLDAERAKRPQNADERERVIVSIKALEGQLKKAQSAVRRYSRSNPELKQNLESLKSAAKEGEALHNKVRINVTIFARKEGRELQLATFGGAYASSHASSSK
jgi:hypothetical protein